MPSFYRTLVVSLCRFLGPLYGATNHETALKYDAFGELLLAQGDHARAQHYFSRALAIYTGSYPPEHQAIRRVRVHLQTAAGMD